MRRVGITMIAVLLSSSAYAIDCKTSLPQKRDGHWSYRIIDGRKCWYAGKSMISKSLLRWPQTKAEPVAREAQPLSRDAKPVSRDAQPVAREAQPLLRDAKPPSGEAQPVAREAQPLSREAQQGPIAMQPVVQEVTGSIVVDQFEARWRKLAPEVKWLVPVPVAQWPLGK